VHGTHRTHHDLADIAQSLTEAQSRERVIRDRPRVRDRERERERERDRERDRESERE
jgi:hypothetical protein